MVHYPNISVCSKMREKRKCLVETCPKLSIYDPLSILNIYEAFIRGLGYVVKFTSCVHEMYVGKEMKVFEFTENLTIKSL